mmetsp:Transcript_11717/g.23590  ORF Transcript_11717/g.23590 Transcript_11717/m.23590 type:complete len:113 (-) Transcript_11717:153-491(-)
MYGLHEVERPARQSQTMKLLSALSVCLAVVLMAVAYFSMHAEGQQLALTPVGVRSTMTTPFAVNTIGRDVSMYGRGDKRTKKGKRFSKSYGNCRQRKGKPGVVYYPKPPSDE